MASGKQQITSKALRLLESFLPEQTPPSLDTRSGNLYQVLSRHPRDGVGMTVSQTRWGQKGIGNSYWLVTRTKLKLEGQYGKAWGKLYWKGTRVLSTAFIRPAPVTAIFHECSGCIICLH